MQHLHKTIIFLLILLIHTYKILLSPFFGKNCNFHPTCSSYAILALKKHGIFKGTLKSFHRIIRCNPWNKTFQHDEPWSPSTTSASFPTTKQSTAPFPPLQSFTLKTATKTSSYSHHFTAKSTIKISPFKLEWNHS